MAADFKGATHLKELYLLLSCIMIRRLKEEVLGDLPPKHRHTIYLEIDQEVIYLCLK